MAGVRIVKDIPGDYTPKQIAKFLQNESFKELALEQSQDNFKDPIFQADKGKRTENKAIIKKAKSFVEISQRAESLAKALKFLIPRLLDKSPVLSGSYRSSHFMDLDNGKTLNLLNVDLKDLNKILEGVSTVLIYNTQIYANKLEREANARSSKRGNLLFINASGVYDFFSKKIRGASFAGVIARVGRSDRYEVRKDPSYTRKEGGGKIVLPVIYLSIGKGAG